MLYGKVIADLVWRNMKTAYAQPVKWTTSLVFYTVVVCIFPLGVGHSSDTILQLAPSVLWLALLLAGLLSFEQFFRQDYRDGSLEQHLLVPCGYESIAFAQIVTHWICVGVPVVVLSPLYALLFGIPSAALATVMAAFLIGTPALSALGAIGASLTVNVSRGGLLLNVLLLPLYIPLLIFGSGSIEMAVHGQSVAGAFAFLGGMTTLLLLSAPFVVSFFLRCLLN